MLRDMGRVKAALDSDGKSPLAVCIEFRMNEWQKAAQLLRDAYKVWQLNLVTDACSEVDVMC